jgi:single-stranded DNA-binding protein
MKTGIALAGGAKLVISLFARRIAPSDADADENLVLVTGTICKPPVLRTTPLGREICDLMLAVRRRYGRSDYLPCIAWGCNAREAADWRIGSSVRLTGRIQSRVYQKLVGDDAVEKTAYEVSVIQICLDS